LFAEFFIDLFFDFEGSGPEDGVNDLTLISNIDETGINTNLFVRYKKDLVYVRISLTAKSMLNLPFISQAFILMFSDLCWNHSHCH